MSSNLAISLVIGASVGGAIAGLKRLQNDLRIFRDSSLSTTKKFTELGKGFATGIGGLVSSTTAISSSVIALSKPAIQFESAMADVKKVVNFDTPEQFKIMEQDILKLTRTIPMAGEEIAAIVAAGGQAGIAKEHLLGYAESAAKMGVAFDMAAGDAGTAMATMANVLGKPIAEMGKFGDAINYLSDNANAKAADIVNVIARAGSDTRMLGLSENEAAALGSTFLSMGKAPELAAQAIKGMTSAFSELKAGKHAKELKMLGLTPKSFANAMNKDAQGAISDFIERVKKLPKDQQYPTLAKMFGKQYADDVILLAQNTGEYNRQLQLLKETDEKGELKFVGSMQREFENRSATTENNLQLLKNSLNEIAVTIGAKLLPVINLFVNNIKPIIYSILEWIELNPTIVTQILQVGGVLAGAVTGIFAVKIALSGVLMIALPFISFWGKAGKAIKFLTPIISKLALGFGYLIGYLAKGAMIGVKAITFLGRAFFLLGKAILTNPIGLAITAIAVGAYLIYSYWEPIKAFFGNLWDWVSQKFNGAWEGIQSAWSGVSNWVSNAWGGVKDFFGNLWHNVTTAFEGGIAGIGTLILNWSPLSVFQQAFSSVLSWFGLELPNTFASFGQNIIDGLVNGIKNAWEIAKNTVGELGSGIKNWFAEKLGIHSPSRVFKGYGVNIVEGLAIGMDNKQSLASQASNELGQAVSSAFNSANLNTNGAVNIEQGNTSQSPFTHYQPLNRDKPQGENTSPIVVHFSPNIQLSGATGSAVEQVKQALQLGAYEFEQLLNRIMDERQRRAY